MNVFTSAGSIGYDQRVAAVEGLAELWLKVEGCALWR